MRVLHLISRLEQNGAGRQLLLLSREHSLADVDVAVCVLGRETPAADALRQSGWAVEALGWTKPLALSAWWRLRRLVKAFRPDVVHAWDARALRTFGLLARPSPARVVTSHAATTAKPSVSWMHRRLLGRVACVVAQGAAEGRRWLAAGVPEEKLRFVPPGVRVQAPTLSAPSVPEAMRVPGRRWIACAGELTPHKGFHDAIWAFDILRYLCDDLHLAILGEGPDRPRLEHLVRSVGATGRVHFLGLQPDAAALLSRADVVWVPDQTEGGVNVALEAMAAGRPVVASDLAGLAEVVVEGRTGFLVPRGDKVTRNRRTRLLLDDLALSRRVGQAALDRAAHDFPAQNLARRLNHLYAGLAA